MKTPASKQQTKSKKQLLAAISKLTKQVASLKRRLMRGKFCPKRPAKWVPNPVRRPKSWWTSERLRYYRSTYRR